MRELLNIVYDENHADVCSLDIYLPDDRHTPCPVFIYFHGGGIEGGNKADPSDLINLTSNGIAFVSVEYRMYPNAKFPDFIEDAARAIAFVKEYGELNNSFKEIYAGGSSAGAYLTMMAYFDRHYLSKYGVAPTDIKGWIFDAGQPTVHFNVLRERGLDPRLARIDEAAPVYFIDHEIDFAMQNRLMFIVAENDMPGRIEQTRFLLKTMEQFNYDMSKVEFRLMNGHTHCSYSISSMVSDFILDKQ
ncbi:MAG: hypothetical protein K0S76_868 [Herbinix sp.]|jgi:dipeptidyl aminopeptidase/acylaminoacyl peptidase|nr:hypothetical protein [Herbinix sp.]